MGKRISIVVKKSTWARSFMNEIQMYGFLLGSFWVNHEFIGGSVMVSVFLSILFSILVLSKIVKIATDKKDVSFFTTNSIDEAIVFLDGER